MEAHFRIISTTWGHVGMVVSRRRVLRIYLPERSRRRLKQTIRGGFPGAIEDQKLAPEFANQLSRYFAGERVAFNVTLDASVGTAFQRDVWKACRKIPYGKTRTYKQLADRAGRPGSARAVGAAMARNPFPIVIPCQRVLKSDGGLGGFSAPGGLNLKKRLLEMEAAQS